jgi:uncharacterized membrane protein YbaN (DUF454 family)
MLSNKDYSQMTLEELQSAEAKLKSQKITTAVFIGVIVGIAVYAATHQKGFFLTALLLFFAYWFGHRYNQSLKRIQAEISSRNTRD